MRQVGLMAAAGFQAVLDFDQGIISHDHRRAQLLAHGLSTIKGLTIDPKSIQTNILFLEIDYAVLSAPDDSTSVIGSYSSLLASKLLQYKVLVLPKTDHVLRLVVHRDLNDDDIQYACGIFKVLMEEWCK